MDTKIKLSMPKHAVNPAQIDYQLLHNYAESINWYKDEVTRQNHMCKTLPLKERSTENRTRPSYSCRLTDTQMAPKTKTITMEIPCCDVESARVIAALKFMQQERRRCLQNFLYYPKIENKVAISASSSSSKHRPYPTSFPCKCQQKLGDAAKKSEESGDEAVEFYIKTEYTDTGNIIATVGPETRSEKKKPAKGKKKQKRKGREILISSNNDKHKRKR